MAVTVDDLRVVLGIAEVSAPPNEDANDRTEREAVNTRNLAIASRLHAICKAEVERYAAAPEHHRDEAMIRMAGYLHADDPAFRTLRRLSAGDGLEVEPRAPGAALRLSGAAALLSPYRVRRAIRAEATA